MTTAMPAAPQILITAAESSAAEYQIGKFAAENGFPPRGWDVSHPCEFGVFKRRADFAVAPLFPHVITDLCRDGFCCVYRTDGASA